MLISSHHERSHEINIYILLLLTSAFDTMSSTPTPATQNVPQAPRPLRREGAQYFLSQAEQALEEAMMRSSPPPEPLLGKRVRDDDQAGDDDHSTEPDEEGSSTTHPQPLIPSMSNLTAATLRYASKKKLRADQRDEVEAFFSVSA